MSASNSSDTFTANHQDLAKRDLAHVWHPCTQMKDHEDFPIIPIKSGQGVWLHDFEGKRYLDGISSWWVNLFGHANPAISEAIKQQADTLEHVLLAGFSHEPVIRLSERLAQLTPAGLEKCFYADNGSSAVEVALKMSFHYWHNIGEKKKTKFVALKNSYHGETLGALAVGDVELYKEIYQPLLLDVITVEGADSYEQLEDESSADFAARKFSAMEELLAQQHDEICAVIVEPLVQCAGNMRMYPPEYLTLLREACDRYGVHLIADEIAVGFGRTGTLFGCEQAAISPDFMCLSKGLTGGYLPLSVVMTSEKIYHAFYGDYAGMKVFLHSHSYTGNALACAAALATLDQFEQRDTIQANQKLIAKIRACGERFRDHPNVGHIRQTGMIFAIELVANKTTREAFPWQQRRGLRAHRYALEQELLLRPLGNVIYFMPPYVITEAEIEWVFDIMAKAVEVAVLD